MPAGLTITIDDARVRRMFDVAPEAISTGLRRLVEGAAIDLQREERIAAPVAVTGQLRSSIRYTYSPQSMTAIVTPEADYAEDVENGTQPHFVTVRKGSPLWQWATLKGINPYAVQHSIAKKGTKPHPFVVPTYEKLRPKIENDIVAGIDQIVAGLDRA